MIYILFDNPSKIDYVVKAIAVAGKPYEVMNIGGENGPFFKKIYSCCRKCSKRVKSGDVIVCWLDIMGVICYWLTKRKDIRIININILLKEKATVKNLIFRKLYRGALQSDRMTATVTSAEYGNYLNEFLNIKRDYELLHDAYNPVKLMAKEGDVSAPVTKKSVFCGGRNGRDWNMIIKIAGKMPDVTFNLVMPADVHRIYEGQFKSEACKNIKCFVEVSRNKFAEVMDSSAIVAMPLDSQAPSGLLVFYQATARGKMIITTDTVTTREYFSDGRGVLCDDSIDSWVEQIGYYLDHEEKSKEVNKKCHEFLIDSCSVENYQRILGNLVRNITDN